MKLPDKWYIKTNSDNIDYLNKFYQEHLREYKGCQKEHNLRTYCMFYYPQPNKGMHSVSGDINTRNIYTEIFIKDLINSKSQYYFY